MNQLVIPDAMLPTAYSVAPDKASFLAYLRASGGVRSPAFACPTSINSKLGDAVRIVSSVLG